MNMPFFHRASLLVAFGFWVFSASTLRAEDTAEADRLAQEVIALFQETDEAKQKKVAAQALPTLERAAKRPGAGAEIHFAAYVCHTIFNRKKESLAAVEKAFALNPDYVGNYVTALMINWRRQEARDVLARLYEEYGHPPAFEPLMAEVDMTLQRYDAAEKYYVSRLKDGASLSPQDKSVFLAAMGEIHLHRGRHKEAIAYLEKSVSAFEGNVPARGLLGEALLKSGQTKRAVETFDKALSINPKSEEPLYFKGVALEALGRGEESRESYRKAFEVAQAKLKINDDLGRDHFILARLSEKLGRKDEAAKYMINAKKLGYTYEAPFAAK